MKILHLAAGNRWTGAAAPAFAEVEALRAAGVDAHYAYVGGYKLQAKLGHHDFAHPIIEKAQNPFAFRRTLDALDRAITHHGFDIVHAHLTYDHWLARFLAVGRPAIRVARTFHARRVLRSDPFTNSLIRRTALLCVVNSTFRVPGREIVFTPPPLDLTQFTPDGADARALYGLDANTKLVTVIGKLSAGRGFEEALQTFAALRAHVPGVKMMIIGHGEHRPVLEALTRTLAIDDDVIWAGYHENDLAEHYRASDLLLFTARAPTKATAPCSRRWRAASRWRRFRSTAWRRSCRPRGSLRPRTRIRSLRSPHPCSVNRCAQQRSRAPRSSATTAPHNASSRHTTRNAGVSPAGPAASSPPPPGNAGETPASQPAGRRRSIKTPRSPSARLRSASAASRHRPSYASAGSCQSTRHKPR
jgi:hypothetical protein